MGRYTNKPLAIPEGVTVDVKDKVVAVKGKMGEDTFKLHHLLSVSQEGSELKIEAAESKKVNTEPFIGLTYRSLENVMKGVTEGFEKILEIEGVGYRWNVKGDVIDLLLGYSHEINYKLPEGITAKADGSTLTISGVRKELVGQVAANIKAYRPVEPYKGKGIRYKGQYVIRKAGKTGV